MFHRCSTFAASRKRSEEPDSQGTDKAGRLQAQANNRQHRHDDYKHPQTEY
ncbi:MAG: hypothetical protein K2J86_08255 [Prevotella sp.]|nr:hypothetical protein [Prevotella sp.]